MGVKYDYNIMYSEIIFYVNFPFNNKHCFNNLYIFFSSDISYKQIY